MDASQKILNALLEQLTEEDLRALLAKKQQPAQRLIAMTEEEKWTAYYQQEIDRVGVFEPPASPTTQGTSRLSEV